MEDVKNENQLVGISWMIFHTFIISVMVIIAKKLGIIGYSPVQIIFFNSIVAFFLILPFAIKKYGFANIFKTKILNLHFYRAFLGIISMVLYYFSLTHVALNDARAVALLCPVISFVFGIFLLKEKVDNKKIIALILSLAGGAIIINPASPNFHPALFLIVVAMFMWSTIEVIMKKISKAESAVKQLLFLTGLMSLLSLLPSIYYWKTPSSNHELYLLLIMGVLLCINSISIFLAIKHANLTTIMPFDFFGMIFTAILTYFIFAEIITFNTMVGAIVVFASSLYLVFHERKVSKAARIDILKE